MAKEEKSPASPTGKPAWIPALKSPWAYMVASPKKTASVKTVNFFMRLILELLQK